MCGSSAHPPAYHQEPLLRSHVIVSDIDLVQALDTAIIVEANPLKHHVPVHTFSPWNDVRPGLVAADRVAPAGTSPDGSVLYILVPCAAGGMRQPMPSGGARHRDRSRRTVPRETSP
jgi:hypothetical protein